MRPILPYFAALALLPGICRGQDDDPAAADLAALEKSATSFVKAFNDADAEALVALFLPNGELVLGSGELLSGRAEIEDHYAGVFTDDKETKGAMETHSVRFVTPSLAIEDGAFHLTAPSGEVSSGDYTAVSVKQDDGSWLLASVRDNAAERAPANEKLQALSWLLGDWIAEGKGADTRATFDWSDDGPFIDARVTTEAAGVGTTTGTLRIGWDANRQDFVSWGFDSAGGYSSSEWNRQSDQSWMLHSRGVTADGETNRATKIISSAPGLEGFTLTRRDQVINGEVQPDRAITFVKLPPAPTASRDESE